MCKHVTENWSNALNRARISPSHHSPDEWPSRVQCKTNYGIMNRALDPKTMRQNQMQKNSQNPESILTLL